ncbi:MAG: hypothetical protein KDA92_24140, partial [Planctomycetales bacterium]|nr:hypothetical protein [Planctomycetales bacterium]
VIGTMLCWLAITSIALGGAAFIDSFEDGNLVDGSPVSWLPYAAPLNGGTVVIEDGSLLISPPTSGPSELAGYWQTNTYAAGQLYHNFSVRTQVHGLADAWSVVGVGGIDSEATEGAAGSGAWGYLIVNNDQQSLSITTNFGTQNIPAISTDMSLSHLVEDINLQFSVYDMAVAVTAWAVGTPQPDVPQVLRRLPDGLRDAEGYISLLAGNLTTTVPVAFRYVDVSPAPWEHNQIAMLPTVQYRVLDEDFDNLGDSVANSTITDLVGEFDSDTSNMVGRVITKFNLPREAMDSRPLQSAKLRFQLITQSQPTGPISLYHNPLDNDVELQASDFEDAGYEQLVGELVQPTDSEQIYYEIDVTDQILMDLASDGDTIMSAFRLQVDGLQFVEDGTSHLARLTGPLNDTPPNLVLTFVPEPTGLGGYLCLLPMLLRRRWGVTNRSTP